MPDTLIGTLRQREYAHLNIVRNDGLTVDLRALICGHTLDFMMQRPTSTQSPRILKLG